MKKLLLSFFVIASFIFYSAHEREEAAEVKISSPLVPTDTPSGSGSSAGPSPTTVSTGVYRDGTYTGKSANAFYGFIQVKATIQNGRITDVQFLDYPSDRSTSVMINGQAMPLLKQEAIQAQKASVDIVSGATDSSMAFRESMQSALSQAQ